MAELVYIDETIHKDFDTRTQTMMHVVGLAVEESKVQALAAKLTEITFKHLGWVPADFEFHSYDIWHGKGPWAEFEPAAKLVVFEDLVSVLDDLELYVCRSSIDLPKLHLKYDGAFDRNAYLLGLQFMLEKLNDFKGSTNLKVLIADKQQEHEFKAIRMVSNMQWAPFQGEVPGKQLEKIIDTIHFVDSKNSPGVQLVDAIAFLIQRSQGTGPQHPDVVKMVEKLIGIISSRTAKVREPWPANSV